MKGKFRVRLPWLLPVAGVCLLIGARSGAQDGYQIGESRQQGDIAPAEDAQPGENAQAASEGPVRLARFAYVKGNVAWRGDESAEWSQATANLPIRQGAQIWVTDGGRAELQFDDGSVLRLGNGALVTLQTLYSDQDGEFTEIRMTDGLVTLKPRHDRSVYQLDTPLVSVKTSGPSELRVGAGDGVEIAVHEGKATIEGAQGKASLNNGDYLDLRDAEAAYDTHELPRPDSWDGWNEERDAKHTANSNRPAQRHLPANIAIVADDLDDYGAWHDDSRYGSVWVPRVASSDWRPYHNGHWTWVNPFGWTWVADEAWGWAPYHYGTWVDTSYGWSWVPGPATQYWSPAVVNFCEVDNQVAWVPLAPVEVRYPSVLSIGFRSGNWSTYFSIGSAGVYYPTAGNYCVGRAYSNTYVNRVTYVKNVTNITNVTNYNQIVNQGYNRTAGDRFRDSSEGFAYNNNQYLTTRHFVPYNTRSASATIASAGAFGGQGTYRSLPAATDVFQRGRAIAAPVAGRAPVAGPLIARPNALATTPTRAYIPNAATPSTLSRPVFRAPLTPAIQRVSQPTGVFTRSRSAELLNGRGQTIAPATPANPTTRLPQNPTGARQPDITRTPGYRGSNSPAVTNPRVDRSVNPARQTAATPTIPNRGSNQTTPNSDRVSAYGNRGRSVSSGAEAAARARESLGIAPGRAIQPRTGTSDSTRTTTPGTYPTRLSPELGSGSTVSPGNRTYTPRTYTPSDPNGTPRSTDRATTPRTVSPERTYTPSAPRTGGYTPRSDSPAYTPRSANQPTRQYTPPTYAPRYGEQTPRASYTPAPTRQYTPRSEPARSAPPERTAPPKDKSSDSSDKGGNPNNRGRNR